MNDFYSNEADISGEEALVSQFNSHKSHRSDQPFAKLLSDNYLSTDDKMHIIDMMNSNRPKAVREVLTENYRHQKRSLPLIDGTGQFNDYYDEVNDKFKDEMLYGENLATGNKAESEKLCS